MPTTWGTIMNIRAMLAADILSGVESGSILRDAAVAEFVRRSAKGGKSAARAAKNLARLNADTPDVSSVVDDHLEARPLSDGDMLYAAKVEHGSWIRAYLSLGWKPARIVAARAELGDTVKPEGISVQCSNARKRLREAQAV